MPSSEAAAGISRGQKSARSESSVSGTVSLSNAGSGGQRSDPGRISHSTSKEFEGDGRPTAISTQVRPSRPTCVQICCIIAENKYFVGFTTFLTVWALIGDDLRLLLTDKPADIVFNVAVITCIVVFGFEIIVSCIGKEDYPMSFFFSLDLLSTVTLVLDLTWIVEMLQGSDEDDGAGQLRSGRAARLGAKTSRVVRMVRLVRILKIYKAALDAKAKQRKREAAAKLAAQGNHGDDDDWDDLDVEVGQDDPTKGQTESRVGKRLSEMTTRRVIVLVISMLLVLPLLEQEEAILLNTSAAYGANTVYLAFKDYLNANDTGASDVNRKQAVYEKWMLRMVYYHNWFAAESGYCGDGQDCANLFYAHLFWVGVQGPNADSLSAPAEKAQLRQAEVDKFVEDNVGQDNIYNYGTMPSQARQILIEPWDTWCSSAIKERRGISLIRDSISGIADLGVICPLDLRISERRSFMPQLLTEAEYDEWHLAFYFDLRPYSRQTARLNMGITGFVCFVLCVSSLSFSHDANVLILRPVENMMKRVEAIRDNPLIAMKIADEEFKLEEIAKAKARKGKFLDLIKIITDLILCHGFRRRDQQPMETVILEKTIIKLGSLLALGFGEAGANIIGQNMASSDTAGVNAMIPGRRVDCMIGISRIRDFGTATEVLQGKIMTFVNQIAEIVHGVVDEFHGAANKNNGDTFLIIWRVHDEAHPLPGKSHMKKERQAEMAVVAFARVVGAVHRSPLLASYRGHPGLQQRLGSDCRVNLTFGLHCGWAIEGAVGSEFKIDASYLSPNVSIATSLERATTVYGVPFIVAESVLQLCTARLVEKCRLIDRVIITGSALPMEVFSVDLHVSNVLVDMAPPLGINWNSRNRFKARQYLESEKHTKLSEDIDVVGLFEADKNIIAMRASFTTQFFQTFNMGYRNYYDGEWSVAKRVLTGTLNMLRDRDDCKPLDDGPSNALLQHMAQYQFKAPPDWPGFRPLSQPGFRPPSQVGLGA